MNQINNVIVSPTDSILKTIEIIDASNLQIALVIDESGKLLGTVTDGDVRRGILKGIRVEEPVRKIMNAHPTVIKGSETRENTLALMKQKQIRHIPVVDDNNRLIHLEVLDQILLPKEQDNWVVLMAGGLGTRMQPLTNDYPKPMLKVGNKPLLETIIEGFMKSGFRRFYLSVNYKAEMIKEYFGDGSQWGAEIRYIYENKRMGTAGALGLLPERPKEPFFVMNADLLTNINFQQILDFHSERKVHATMCIREYQQQIPYGVVLLEKCKFMGIDEKPIQMYFINAGIYVLDPSCLDFIPQGEYFDMPSLFKKLNNQLREIIAFPIREYWVDIGQMGDFIRANDEYLEVFG